MKLSKLILIIYRPIRVISIASFIYFFFFAHSPKKLGLWPPRPWASSVITEIRSHLEQDDFDVDSLVSARVLQIPPFEDADVETLQQRVQSHTKLQLRRRRPGRTIQHLQFMKADINVYKRYMNG